MTTVEWTTPKTDWKETDKYNVEDYNRIGKNLRYLLEVASDLYSLNYNFAYLQYIDGSNVRLVRNIKPETYETHYLYPSEFPIANYVYEFDADNMYTLYKLLLLIRAAPSSYRYTTGNEQLIYQYGSSKYYYYGYYLLSYGDNDGWESVMTGVRNPTRLTYNSGYYTKMSTYAEYLDYSPNYDLENTPFWTAAELNIIESKINLVKQSLDSYNS